MLRGIVTTLLIYILFALASQANAADRPTLAKIIVNREAIVGELMERTEKHVRLLEIKSNKLRTFSMDEIKSVRVDISEDEAALSVGLPEYLAWNIRRLTPTTGVNTVVVLPLCNASGQQTVEGRQFAENVTTELVRNDVRVVERTLLDKIVGELALQNSRGFDAATAQKIGKQLGAFVVLTGTIVQKRKGYVAQLRLIKVETGEILFAATHRMPDITSKPQVVKNVKPPVVMPHAKPQERRPVPRKKKQAPPQKKQVEPQDKKDVAEEKLEVKLRCVLRGHKWQVWGLEFSPDSLTLASCGPDKSVRIWDATTGNPLQVLENKGFEGLAYSPNAPLIAAGLKSGPINLVNAASGHIQSTLEGHSKHPLAIAFSPDGKTLASGSHDGTLRIWDVKTSAVRKVLDGYGDIVHAVAFSPDGKLLAFGAGPKGEIHILDVGSGKIQETFKGSPVRVSRIAFLPDGSTLVSGGQWGPIQFWNVSSGNLIDTWENGGNFAVSPDGSLIAHMNREKGKLTFTAVVSKETLASIDAHDGTGWTYVRFAPDGKTVATTRGDKLIKVWDVRRLDQQNSRPAVKAVPQSKQETEQKSVKLEFQQALEGHNGEIVCIDLSSDGSVLASTGTDGTVRVWDLTRNSCIHIKDINATSEAVDINQDGTLLAAGNKEGHLFVWRLPSLEEVISTNIGQSEILTVRFSDQSPFVACLTRDGRVMYHHLDGSRTYTRWENPTGRFAIAYALSREGAYLAWGGMGVLSVRKNRGDGPEVEYNFCKDLYSPSRLQFCPVDESCLIGVGFSSNDIHLWDVVKGKQVRRYVGHTKPPFSISFSPDGKIIASVGRDGTLRLWDYHSADNLVTLKPDYGKTVWAVMFHPEGHTLFTGGADGTIKVWKLVSQQSTPKQQSTVDKPVGSRPENIIRVEPVPVEGPPAEK